jgi:hypothetical protein
MLLPVAVLDPLRTSARRPARRRIHSLLTRLATKPGREKQLESASEQLFVYTGMPARHNRYPTACFT